MAGSFQRKNPILFNWFTVGVWGIWIVLGLPASCNVSPVQGLSILIGVWPVQHLMLYVRQKAKDLFFCPCSPKAFKCK